MISLLAINPPKSGIDVLSQHIVNVLVQSTFGFGWLYGMPGVRFEFFGLFFGMGVNAIFPYDGCLCNSMGVWVGRLWDERR